MNVRLLKVIIILIASSIIGLLVNFLSGKGMPLINKSEVISFAEDSIIFIVKDSLIYDEITKNDSVSFTEEKNTEAFDSENSGVREIIKNKDSANDKIEVKELEEPQNIRIETALKLFNSGALFIDARENEDFLAGHIKNSINIPYYDFDNYKHLLDSFSKSETIVTYCSGTDCDLSIMLGNKLFELGFKKVYIFFGGWNDWQAAGYPVEDSESQ